MQTRGQEQIQLCAETPYTRPEGRRNWNLGSWHQHCHISASQPFAGIYSALHSVRGNSDLFFLLLAILEMHHLCSVYIT